MPTTDIDKCQDNAELQSLAKSLTKAVQGIASDIAGQYLTPVV
jgi:hypothetical protein